MLRRGLGGADDLVARFEFGEQPREAQAPEELTQSLAVGFAAHEIGERERKRDVVPQRGESLREPRRIGLLLERAARSRRRDLAGVREQVLECSVLGDQLRGALLADPLHTGNVVGGIADQGAQVEHARGRHAEALLHLRRAVTASLHGVDQRDALRNELHQVLVGRQDRTLMSEGAAATNVAITSSASQPVTSRMGIW